MGTDGRKERRADFGGPMDLAGGPVLGGLIEGGRLFQSVPIIDVDSGAALRKGGN